MTLVVYPEGVTKSGSGGGTTHSHNRFGAYTRTRTIPVNPNTQRQVNMRNFLAALTIAWQNTLTQVQRDAWEVYADNVPWLNKLGQTVHLTGFNHYLRSNAVRLQNTGTVPEVVRVDDAPVIFNLATPEQLLSFTASEATQLLSIVFDDTADWNAEAGGFQPMYQGLPQNAGITFFGGPYRLLGAVNGATPGVSPAAFAATFPIALGQRVWIRSRIGRADARLSEFAFAQIIVAA